MSKEDKSVVQEPYKMTDEEKEEYIDFLDQTMCSAIHGMVVLMMAGDITYEDAIAKTADYLGIDKETLTQMEEFGDEYTQGYQCEDCRNNIHHEDEPIDKLN